VSGGRLLAAQRTAPPALAGLWEFPGGKVEAGEDDGTALRRECREELGVDVEVGDLLGVLPVPVGMLHVYWATLADGTPQRREHAALRWLSVDELFDVPWIPVDLALIGRIAETLRAEGPRSP
jgi:8-oxo-dGTP diphosphatase